MYKPSLFVIAGCNGAGKSTFSRTFLPEGVLPFDADFTKKQIYDAFTFDFELRELMSWNKTCAQLETEVAVAIDNKKDFAYETNFNNEPLYWVKKFKEAGHLVHLLFFCLESVELAIERVAIRFQNGGHFVPNDEVRTRYYAGFENLSKYFQEFNEIMILESSEENKKPRVLLLHNMDRGITQEKADCPEYLKNHCPQLAQFVAKA